MAPRACIHKFWHSRQLICVNDAYIKSDKKLFLLIFITLDANEEILLLIEGFARSESKESWLNFLRSFGEYFLDNLSTTKK